MNENRMDCMIYPDIVYVESESTTNEGILVNNSFVVCISLEKVEKDPVFVITFPWGVEENRLTTHELAQQIVCTPLSKGCAVNEMYNREWGKYWVAVCNGVTDSTIRLEFSDVNLLNAGISCGMVKITDKNTENGVSSVHPFMEVPLRKENTVLRILKFTTLTGTVEKGQKTTLEWCVQGAKNCILDPGNYQVKAMGNKQIFLEKDTEFTLRAWSGKKAVSARVMAYVQ